MSLPVQMLLLDEGEEEEEEAAGDRERLNACVLKELDGEAEPGSGPRTRFHWEESGDRTVTSPMARSQHLSVWRELRGEPAGWAGMTGPKHHSSPSPRPCHAHVEQNSFHTSQLGAQLWSLFWTMDNIPK